MYKTKKEILHDAVEAFVTTFCVVSGIMAAILPVLVVVATDNNMWYWLFTITIPVAFAMFWGIATD